MRKMIGSFLLFVMTLLNCREENNSDFCLRKVLHKLCMKAGQASQYFFHSDLRGCDAKPAERKERLRCKIFH